MSKPPLIYTIVYDDMVMLACVMLGLWVACPRDKFHYHQHVKITGGFYQGQVGTITEDKLFWRYSVKLGDYRNSKLAVISQFNLDADIVGE